MRATSHRRDWTRLAWGAAVAAALALALGVAARATVRAIQARERAAVLAEGDALLRLALAQADTLRRLTDSLRIAAAQRDTVVGRTLTRARTVAATPIPPATDTTALLAAVYACRATLDTLATDCEAARLAAMAALAAAQAQHVADSTRDALRAQQLAAITRSRDAAQQQLAGRSRWQAFERGVCAASIAGNVLQWRAR